MGAMAVYDQAIQKLHRAAIEATSSRRTTRNQTRSLGRVLMDSRQVSIVQRITFVAGAVAGAVTVGAIVLLFRYL